MIKVTAPDENSMVKETGETKYNHTGYTDSLVSFSDSYYSTMTIVKKALEIADKKSLIDSVSIETALVTKLKPAQQTKLIPLTN